MSLPEDAHVQLSLPKLETACLDRGTLEVVGRAVDRFVGHARGRSDLAVTRADRRSRRCLAGKPEYDNALAVDFDSRNLHKAVSMSLLGPYENVQALLQYASNKALVEYGVAVAILLRSLIDAIVYLCYTICCRTDGPVKNSN